MYCQSCGKPSPDDCTFCTSCGATLHKNVSVSNYATPPIAPTTGVVPDSPTVFLVKQPLALKRKLAIITGLLLLASLILSFLPVSFVSSHWYYDSRSSSLSASTLVDALTASAEALTGSVFLGNLIFFLYLSGLISTTILLFIASAGKKAPQNFFFWLTLVPSVMYGISCLIILTKYTYNDFSNFLHYYDVMWGMVLHIALLIASLVVSAIIQFKKEVQK